MKANPLRVYLAYSFITSALYQMIFTVNLLYYILVARLDPLQLVLVGTFLETSVFLFEIPTGVVADTISRRKSVLIGVFLIGISFLINGIWPIFWVISAAQVLWGLGHTFTSGALQAWISDEVGEENSASAFLNGGKMEQWGGMLGVVASIAVALISLRAPILLGGALFLVLGAFLVICMPETGFKPAPAEERTSWKQFGQTFKNGMQMVNRRPVLLSILGIGFFFGLFSEGYDRLWQAHILKKFSLPALPFQVPLASSEEFTLVFWFGCLKILLAILSVLALSLLSEKWKKPEMQGLITGLSISSMILVVSLIGFALAGNLTLMLALVVVIGVIREVINPLYTAWVNHRLDSSVRATVLSLSSQVDAIGQIAGGPVVGVIAKQFSMSLGIITSGILLAPVLVMLGIQKKKEKPLP